jgi:hypothetical protein
MARILVAACLSLTLILTGCASTSKRPPPDRSDSAAEPSPYRSYKWIKHESWWQKESPADTPVRDALVEAGQVTTVALVGSLYVALVVLYLFAPRAAGQ